MGITVSRQDNLELNVREYLAGETLLTSLPPVLFLELTQNCNLSCVMCRSGHGYDAELDMSDDMFSYVADTLFTTSTIVDLRGWGESTILKSFNDRLRRTISAGPKIRLVTNALSLKPDTWWLLMSSAATVIVSLDAADASTFSKLGRGSLKKVLDSLDVGLQARDKTKAGRISVNTVLSSVNFLQLPEIVRLVADRGIGRLTVFPIVASRNNPLHLAFVRERIPEAVQLSVDTADRFGVELRFGASLDEQFVVEYGLMRRCSHPWSFCYVDYAGRVGYCDHLIGHPDLTLGDLKFNGFDEIWNGDAFQNLRRRHLNALGRGNVPAGLLPHCEWCYHRRYVDFEDEIISDSKHRVVSNYRALPVLGRAAAVTNPLDFLSEYL